jgi:hypothetical protein
LKRTLEGLEPGAPALAVWQRRLEEFERSTDPLANLLAGIDGGVQPVGSAAAPSAAAAALPVAGDSDAHRVHLPDGGIIVGTWPDIVEALRQLRSPGEPVAQFMRRLMDEAHRCAGVTVAAGDARSFVLAGAQAGFWQVEY